MGGIMSNSKVSPTNHKHTDIESGGNGERVKASDELLYRIAKTGKAKALTNYDEVSSWLSPAAENTLLHVAAQHGNEDIVKFISDEHPSLVLKKNLRGDTALHLAAKAGHEATVKALVDNHQGEELHNLSRAKNKNENTALHEALLFNTKDESVAKYLIKRDPELLYITNKNHESAMYLAVKAGFKSCISLARRRTPEDQQRLDELFKKNSTIIMEAIQKKDDTGVLEAIYGLSKEFTQFRDGEKKRKNPLHYAASLGYYKMTHYLLKICGDYATQRDENGSLPIHLASIEGHVKVVELLLKDILDPEELLDNKGRNILHLAAENGRDNVVKFLLNKTNLEYHTNMKDKAGNTALHLATENRKPMVVRILTWHKIVYIDAVNGQGKTALEVAETNMESDGTNTQWLTINALRTAGATRTQSVTATKKEKTATNKKIYKEKVNFRLLVAILIATVAFEAGFRLPNEQDNFQSKSNSSIEKMLRRNAFTIYVFSNTIAMYSSIAAAVVLSWAQSGDLTLVITALNFTLPLFWLALSMMSMAFTAGVYLVINDHKWLRIASLTMGVAFHMFLLFNSLVLFSPIVSSNRYLRYLCYYPFRFLVLMNSGWLTNTSRLRYFMWSTQH